MDYKTLIVEKKDGVAKITLNRPEARNAISDQLIHEMAQAQDDLTNDKEIRVVVITGAGKSFCAGADFQFSRVRTGEVEEENAEDQRSLFNHIHEGRLFSRVHTSISLGIQRMDKITIAMVNGDAVGGGFDISLACDMRIGSSNSRFMVGYTRMGVIPDGGGTWLLPRIVGVGKALELIYTSDLCDAEEAYRIGILNKLVAPEKLEEVTMELATRLAKGAPIAQRLSKAMVYKGLEFDLETAMQFLTACTATVISSEDYKEAIRAFAEKRAPQFKGR
jgi:enoyl-CoA hydratase/carnithine racemase